MRVRRLVVPLLASLLALVVLPGLPSGAQAATGYKYWNYFHATASGWTFADTGPADYTPADGSVEGWRFGVSVGTKGREPRAAGDFDAICAGTPAEPGKKRVAVVIDYGIAAEAPDGQSPPDPVGRCAVVSAGFNGQQVLDSVAEARIDKGLVCGIDGYPASGCSETVKDASVPGSEPSVQLQVAGEGDQTNQAGQQAAEAESDSGFPWALVGVIAVVVVIGAAGLATVRRRRA